MHFFLTGAWPAGMSVERNIIRFRHMQKRGVDAFKVEKAMQGKSPSAH
jgi:hypothetical protein